jgi:hypothetical protein
MVDGKWDRHSGQGIGVSRSRLLMSA